MYDAKIVGERIKELRKKKGLTQSQVAEILCISDKSTVSKIENGIKPLSIDLSVQDSWADTSVDNLTGKK